MADRLLLELPGEQAHLKMASRVRLKELDMGLDTTKATKSAVLILFYPDAGKIFLPFILRPPYDGVHSGQVAFPGGRCEKEDKTIVDTALREANEEVNINPEEVTVLGQLTDLYIPPSNYLVTPVVAYAETKPDFKKDPAEVASIIQADIEFLFNPKLRKKKILQVREFEIDAPYFDINNHVVWGATAMMLSELSDLIESIN